MYEFETGRKAAVNGCNLALITSTYFAGRIQTYSVADLEQTNRQVNGAIVLAQCLQKPGQQ